MGLDLRSFIDSLAQKGELVEIREQLSTKYEVSAAIKYIAEHDGRAAFFERVSGYSIPVVGNLLGTKKRIAMAMGVDEPDAVNTYLVRRKETIRPRLAKESPAYENVVEGGIDILGTVPVLIHHELDAGPYLTASITIARDPETGSLGMGVHRVQVKDKDIVGIFLYSPPISEFLRKAENKGQPLEIAIVNGVHPAILMASIVKAPIGRDKFEVAGGLLGKPVDMVECKTVDVQVPAMAEFVLEGKVLPMKREQEGPFGESTGFYFSYNNPIAKIHSIAYKSQPIYQALVPFAGEDAALMNFVWGLENMESLKQRFPFVRDVKFKGVNYMVVVQIKKTSNDDVYDLAEYMLRDQYVKVMVVVDTDVDIYSANEVVWAICTRVQPEKDVHIKEGLPGVAIDPSLLNHYESGNLLTSKILVDATVPFKNRERYKKVDIEASVKARVIETIRKYIEGR